MTLYESQAFVFLVMVYGGIVTGLVYEFYRLLRRIFGTGRIVTAVFDILFVLCAFFIFAYILYLANAGQLRFYLLLGYVLGFLLYVFGISRLLNTIYRQIHKLFMKKRKSD